MGLSGKSKSDAEKDLARAIARRGAPGEVVITAMAATGRTRPGGAAREIEFSLRLEVAGTACEPAVRQFMNDLSLTGLAPGEPVRVLHDRDDPAVLIVMQSPKYVFAGGPDRGQSLPVISYGDWNAGRESLYARRLVESVSWLAVCAGYPPGVS